MSASENFYFTLYKSTDYYNDSDIAVHIMSANNE